ncbi:MAG: dihydrolipoamide acetyltransferase family protein [Phototrophicaceae bacterium]
MADITLTMDGLLLNWLKEVGDSVSAGDVIAEFEADKATVEVESPADGVLSETLIDIGDEVDEGTVIARVGDSVASSGSGSAKKADPEPAQEEQSAPAPSQASSNGTAATTSDGRVKASPLAKKIAEDKGINLANVVGSGPGGRIVKADVENYTPPKAEPAPVASGAPAYQSYGKLPEGDHVEITDVSRMRKAIAKGTITSFNTTPHFYVLVETDVAELLKLRKELNADLAEEGIKISVNDMIVKATALSLKKFPNLNSHYYGDKLVRHKRVNVAIAVALPDNGLVNVVSVDADKMPLSVMAEYHKQMFSDSRDGKIKSEYIKDGTFLVSNLGAYGVESFSSIIDPPQSGALAVGASQKVPIVKEDGTLGIGMRMKVSLSIDHRVSDGAEGAQFLQHFKWLIENPMRLLV